LLAVAVCAAAAATAYGAVQAARRDPVAWDDATLLVGVVRPFSTLGHANVLGAFLAMTAPLAAAFALRAARAPRRGACRVRALGAAGARAGAARALAGGAWGAALAGRGVLAVGWWRGGARRAALLVAGLPLLAAAPLALHGDLRAGLTQRLAGLADAPGRPQAWRGAWAPVSGPAPGGRGTRRLPLCVLPLAPAR